MRSRILLACIVAVTISAFLLTSAAPAVAGGKPSFTFAVADLGQGAWGGGVLFSDGSVRGAAGISFGDGTTVGTVHFTNWFPVGATFVAVCGILDFIKPDLAPFLDCLVVPITGTPVFIDFDGDGNPDLMIRVTQVN